MNAPPGSSRAAGARWNGVGEKDPAVGAALVSRLVGVAREHPELRDLSANKISRVVRSFIATGQQERDFVSYVVGYADPTGEAAVRNVLREQRRAS